MSGTTPRVSVICIFFNEERYFSEAVDSVLAQDFRDFELLLVDDGSSDTSSSMAKEYAAREPDRIRVMDHPGLANRGMSATRNLGLSEARGELIAFIDADDRWSPSKLTEQVTLLDSMPDVDAVGGSVRYWSSHQGGKDRIVPTGHVQNQPIPPVEATLKLYPLGKADAPSMSDLLFRRSAIDAVGRFEDAFRGAYEDQAFLAKFYLNSALYFASSVWSDYRLHDQSCMATVAKDGRYDEARRSFLEWFEAHLESRPVERASEVRRALDKALRRYRRQSTRAMLADSPIGTAVRKAKASCRQLRPVVAPGPAILMYHRVADESFDPWGLAVSPANFADQLNWITQHRAPMPLPEFVDLSRQGRLPRNAFAITFDDGYACNSATAAPLLREARIPATIFLPTELVERGREFWWDELQQIVLTSRAAALDLDGRVIALGTRQEADDHWSPAAPPQTSRQRAYHQLWTLLYPRAPSDLDASLDHLREQAGLAQATRDSHRPMNLDEVRAMRSELVEFGSHARTHASLPKLTPEGKADEILRSVERCQALTGVRPRSFAYPYGDHDAESEALVEQAGFTCACLADGWFVTKRSNRFALPRIFVGNWDAARLARQLGRP